MSAVTDLEAEGPLAELVRRLRGSRKRVRLTTPDGDEAFVISREDLDELERAERAEDAADVEAFDRAVAEDDGERVPLADVKARLGL